MFKSKKEKGITMVALVVTLVVLLILAGIGINAITKENGIIKNAEESKKQTEIAELKEQIQRAIIEAEGEHYNTTIDHVIQKLIEKKIIVDSNSVNKTTGAITTKSPTYVFEGMLNDYLKLDCH